MILTLLLIAAVIFSLAECFLLKRKLTSLESKEAQLRSALSELQYAYMGAGQGGGIHKSELLDSATPPNGEVE